ncbi:MAG: FHA domain-containing protein [Thermoguttaceae bacterium]|jgi:pSer/pThr/pTyr-binding forkhead associated (FHA) protein
MQVQLKVVNGRQRGHLISINRPKFMIGRADDCQLKSKNELISRHHCVILTEEGYVGVRELGSRNGVYVNGVQIDEETELRNGDLLTIGPLEFEVVITVAMSTGKKPKVESIAEVVARTVEQSSLSTVGKAGGDVSSWLMSEDDAIQAAPSGSTIEMKRPHQGETQEETPQAETSQEESQKQKEEDSGEDIFDNLVENVIAPEKETKAVTEDKAKDEPSPTAPTGTMKKAPKPKPVLNLNLDEEDDGPPAKEEEKPKKPKPRKKPPIPQEQVAAKLKDFFQNR